MASDDGRIYVARHDTDPELKNLLKISNDMEEVKERLTIIEQKIDKLLGSKATQLPLNFAHKLFTINLYLQL